MAVETIEDFGDTPEGTVKRWKAEIEAYKKQFNNWTLRSKKIVKRYRDENLDTDSQDTEDTHTTKNFNAFWSNVETLKPALLAQMPKVIVKRRYQDRDRIALAAADILRRSITQEMDVCNYEEPFKASRDDYLMTARGTVWARYVPEYGTEKKAQLQPKSDGIYEYADGGGNFDGDPEFENDQAYTSYKPVIGEKVYIDHVLWSDFGHTPAPNWTQVGAVWRRTELTRTQLIRRFGDKIGKEINLTKSIAGVAEEFEKQFPDAFKRAEVYEIWDKESRKVIWISEGLAKPLDTLNDPLKLMNFFPCPPPLYATITRDKLVPVPDYLEYQAQAIQLDVLTQRIDRLTAAMKIAGVYNGEFHQLQTLFNSPETTLIAVDQWAMFAEGGGLSGAIDFVPIKEVAETLRYLIDIRNQQKQDLYEISGISDIVRGQSRASETATAQEIKGRFVTLRLKDRQRAIALFIRNTLEIVGEIMAEHFNPQVLIEMSGWLNTSNAETIEQETPGSALMVAQQAVQLLKEDRLRTFKVNIETGTTIMEDMEFEKSTRIEFLQSVSLFMQNAIPIVEEYPELRQLLGQLLMYGVRAFDKGSDLEEVFEKTLEDMSNAQVQSRQMDQETQQKMSEMQQKMTEMGVQLRDKTVELELKNREISGKQQLEQQKLLQSTVASNRQMNIQEAQLEDTHLARIDKRVNEIEDRDFERVVSIEDNLEERGHEMRIRRLDNLPTDKPEEDMRETTEAIERLADMVEAQIRISTQLIEQNSQLIQVMAAPREVIRDPETGAISGSRVNLE